MGEIKMDFKLVPMKKIIINILFVLCSTILYAQGPTVRGKVYDETNEPLIGASVLEKGTANGMSTGLDGEFNVTLSKNNAILQVQFVGYKPYELKVKESMNNLKIVLEPDQISLDEVVVVGYGQQKKASVVGAISVVDNKKLQMAAPANLTNAIAGQITGAIVRLSDGNIGGGTTRYSENGDIADADIFIRGKATTNSAAPLILVDGIESSFSNINPEDVEQMSVLKDASATAVYGVRGANGVILITTKRGQLGKPKVSVRAEYRIHKPLKYPKFLGAYEYAYLYNEASRNMGLKEKFTAEDLEHWKKGDDPYGHPDVNWRDMLVRDHFSEKQATFNINGGTKLVKYYISGEYLNAGGPFKGRDFKDYSTNASYNRYNLRTNLDFNLTKSTTLKVSLNGTVEKKNDANHGDSSGQRYAGSFWWDIANLTVHEFPVFNPDGTLNYGLPPTKPNVYGELYGGGYTQRDINSFQTNINLEQKLDFILKGLSVRAMYGGTFNSGSRLIYNIKPAYWNYYADSDTYRLAEAATVPTYTKTTLSPLNKNHFEFSINYNRTFAEDHKVSLMGIYTLTKSELAYNLPVNYQGLAGRATYAYKDKYLAEFNVGYNGSDQFAEGNRYAILPAGSIGWVLSQESFFKENVSFVDFFKLRASYGTAGNDKIGSYRFLYDYVYNSSQSRWGQYSKYPGVYEFGEEAQKTNRPGVREGVLGNDKVTWEIAYKTNLGVDFTLFNNKLSGSFDYFYEDRKDILARREDLPTQNGLLTNDLPAQNIGRVENRGYEITLNFRDNISEFKYNLGLNYTFARNKIKYIAEVEKAYDYQMQKGHPIDSYFGYTWTGSFYDFDDLENPNVPKPTYPVRPGDLMFKDLNGDGVIDDYDKGVIGYAPHPEIIYGFNIGMEYKNLYLNIFLQGAAHVSSSYGSILMNEFTPNVQPKHKGRWVYDPERGLDTRKTATYPALDINGGSQATKELSTFNLINSNYLRVKTIEVGYFLPKKIIEKAGFSSAKVYLNGSNLFTFNKYEPIDPEYYAGSSGAYYPQTKYASVGLNVTF